MVSMLYIIIGKEAKITLKKPVKFGLDILTKLHFLDKKLLMLGRGGGQVVSLLAFYSDDPSSNPAEAYSVRKERK